MKNYVLPYLGSTTLRNKETTTCGSSKITQRKEKGEKENLIKERAEKEKAHSNTYDFDRDFKRQKKIKKFFRDV